ncbi:MAG: hypothetical protein H0X45_12380 [Planctomycetes bacterium]|nr:hypothetical protein [Planctomycetota bacterium]
MRVALALMLINGVVAAESPAPVPAPVPAPGVAVEAALSFVVYGMPGPATMKAQELLRERYGVELALGGCVVDDDALRATEAANAEVRAALSAKHGRDIIDECFADGEAAVAGGR